MKEILRCKPWHWLALVVTAPAWIPVMIVAFLVIVIASAFSAMDDEEGDW